MSEIISEIQKLNHRNTITVEQALKQLTTKIENQQIRIDGLNSTMSIMAEKMNFLEKLIIEHKIKSIGTGPSVIQ